MWTSLLNRQLPRDTVQQRLQDLQSTIEAALAEGNFERVLRLVIQNLPKNRHFMPLRRYVAMVAIGGGQPDVARQILDRVAHFELEHGNLLGALLEAQTLKNLSNNGDELLEEIIAAATSRTFNAMLDRKAVAPEPDLTGDKPPLPLPALIAVAREMAVHPPPEAGGDALDPITLMEDLEPKHVAWILGRLQVGTRSAGQLILGPDNAVAWIVEGSIALDGGETWFPATGTMVGPGRASHTLTSASGTKVLTLSMTDWNALTAHTEVAAAVSHVRDRQVLLRALTSTHLIALFSAASQREVIGALQVFRAKDGPVLKQGTVPSGIHIVIDGELRGVSRDEDIAIEMGRLHRGDLFGVSAAFGDEALDRSFEVVEAAVIGVIPGDVLRGAMRRDPEARRYLENLTESSVLQTGEVILLDEDG